MTKNQHQVQKIPSTDDFRKRFLPYSKQAFEALPKMEMPRLLDVGCGSGAATIKLAEWLDGEIIGIDIDNGSLDSFREKIKNKALSSRIKAIKTSFIRNDFKDHSFNILWAEGVFHIIGYDKSLKESYRLLTQKGFLVIVDTLEILEKNKKKFKNCGFKVYDQINWEENAWWTEYYGPLEAKIKELKNKKIDLAFYSHLTDHEQDINLIKRNPKKFDCAHLILQKINKKIDRKED